MPSGVYKRTPENTKNGPRFQIGNKINQGRVSFRKGKTGIYSEETLRLMREHNPHNKPWLGKKRPEQSLRQVGDKNPSWRGGKSFETYTTDWTNSLRISIRERDHYTCQICGEKQGDCAFPVHHIDYNKKNCNPNNLITLCLSCHMKTNGRRDYWKNYFITFINK